VTKPKAPPCLAVRYDPEVIPAAVRAFFADPAHAVFARWLIEELCGTYQQPFFLEAQGGERAGNFMCGRMFVGQELVRLSKLAKAEGEGGGADSVRRPVP
jgi:hypothetical protein